MKTDAELIALMQSVEGTQDFSTLVNLCHLLMSRHGIEGDVVEMGCYRGHTAALMSAVSDKRLWLYDSFDGLPDPTIDDESRNGYFQRGIFRCTTQDVRDRFLKNDLPEPTIVSCWFQDLKPEMMPQKIALAHIDADFYKSTLDALSAVYPRLTLGALCVIHDYGWNGLPGVKPAVEHFLETEAEAGTVKLLPTVPGVMSKQAYFVKL